MLAHYFQDLQEYPTLTVEEERRLAQQFQETGDRSARDQLIIANLRFVVSIARKYRGYRIPLEDLIQQGNLGLLDAVRKFEPERGHRLISYAVWWIRAYIQQYIIHTWSLVKVGTTQTQRKLFFRLNREWRRLENLGYSDEEAVAALAERFHVPKGEVRDMAQRTSGRDISLELEHGEHWLPDGVGGEEPDQETQMIEEEQRQRLSERLQRGFDHLMDRERYILERRYLAEEKPSRGELGRDLHLSRERVRQLELAALDKLRVGL